MAAPTVETPVYNASTGRVTFSWNEAENVEKYRVELSTADGDVRVYVLNGSATSQSFGSLEAGKTYYFRARAHQASGAGNSAWSEVVEFTVPTATEAVSDAFADFFAEEGEDDFWFEFEKALGGRSK